MKGRLPPPKGGAPVEDYEDREQTLFRATAYGDDVDRPLMSPTAATPISLPDIANHKNKFDRGFSQPHRMSSAPITAATSSACRRRSKPSRRGKPRWM
jgi:hypothetical protein